MSSFSIESPIGELYKHLRSQKQTQTQTQTQFVKISTYNSINNAYVMSQNNDKEVVKNKERLDKFYQQDIPVSKFLDK